MNDLRVKPYETKVIRYFRKLADLQDEVQDVKSRAKPRHDRCRSDGCEIRHACNSYGGEHVDEWKGTLKQIDEQIEHDIRWANEQQEYVNVDISGSYHVFDTWEDYYANEWGVPDGYWDVEYAVIIPAFRMPDVVIKDYPFAYAIKGIEQAFDKVNGWRQWYSDFTPKIMESLAKKHPEIEMLCIELVNEYGEHIGYSEYTVEQLMPEAPQHCTCPECKRPVPVQQAGTKYYAECDNLLCKGWDRTGYTPEGVWYFSGQLNVK